ncbi:hypothetical protein ACFO3O_06665 [Dokdonia ponticola]|uniref:Tetratricopeptide repeat protein n=1 Tax=Dokdonia ponticola TaxID=2041041 RepID=A0ABV9HUN3_9FLAO
MILILAYFCSSFLFGQQADIIKEPIEIISTRSVYLNSGFASNLGGGVSRTYIKVDLPPNTIKWYYSFTTSTDKSASQNLNLIAQLASLYYDPSGLSSNNLPYLEVPTGVCGIDVYLLDQENVSPFLDKEDLIDGGYSYYLEGTINNTKQAVVEIDEVIANTLYLGLKNPDGFTGVNIILEVVAITEIDLSKQRYKEEERASLYGTLAWSCFENKDYDKALLYCNTSSRYYKLGWVEANKGLTQLVLGDTSKSLDTYIHAIPLIKEQLYPEYVFDEVIKDLENVKNEFPDLEGVTEVMQLIKLYRD